MIKNKLKKNISACLTAVSITIILPINAHAEWKELDDFHYGYMENGNLYKGWKQLSPKYSHDDDNSVEKSWYYFDENGVMKTNDWIKTDNKWYYVGSDGARTKDCIVDGYAIGADGAWIKGPGWRQYDKYGKYYGETNENMLWYYFDKNGLMKTNSWVETNGKWYYLRDDGSMATNCFINGYPIDMDGAWISDGGWKKDNKGWWFSYGNGKGYATGWKSFDDPFYNKYDYENLTDGTIKYYFDQNGYMKTGWLQYDDKWYYLKDDGSMAVNTTVYGYIIGEDGVWIERLGHHNWTEDIVTVPEKSVYPLGTEIINFDIINNTGKIIEQYFPYTGLEKYENNKWIKMDEKMTMKDIPDGMEIDMPAPIYIKKVYSTNEHLTSYKGFDSSKPGKYRISFNSSSNTYRFIEFEIK